MKLPQYRLLKVSAKDKITLEAEVMDIVTCGECKYGQKTNYIIEPYLRCGKWSDGDNHEIVIAPDDFCSYGERSE